MTALQEQAVQMIHGMSDENVGFLIEVIHRLIPQNTQTEEMNPFMSARVKKMQAFKELDAARTQIQMYLPDNFDPDKELEEARAEKYDRFD